MPSEKLIKSPLNYTGGKFKLLPQILPFFPKEIDVFYDIFCGGANVAINVSAKKIIGIDINKKIIELYNYFLTKNPKDLCDEISEIINLYKLSNSNLNGYEYYNSNSSDGLGEYNKNAFINLKKNYNDKNFQTYNKNLLFYVLIIYGFNNQIRFNQKDEFNIPVGKRDFNQKIKSNLVDFLNKLHNSNIVFKCSDYNDFILDEKINNFVYADPPYLITTATYNESDGWNDIKEKNLLDYLNSLNNKGVKFALSNVIEHKNKKNEILEKWINDNGYIMHGLNFSYNNSSYQSKSKDTVTKEILVTNYK